MFPFSSPKVYLLFKELPELAVSASQQLPVGLQKLPLLGLPMPPQHIWLRKATIAGLPVLLRPPSGFLYPPGVFLRPLPWSHPFRLLAFWGLSFQSFESFPAGS